MRLQDLSAAVLVVLIWGVNFSAIKIGLQELPPILFSALRFVVVAIPAVFFVPFPGKSWLPILGVGIFLGVLKFTLLFVAMQSEADAGIASLLLQAQVFFTIFIGVLLFKEKLHTVQILGLLLAGAGFSCFLFSGEHVSLLGLGLLLLAAFCWSVANLIMKQLQQVNLVHFMVWVSLVPPIPLALLSYFLENDSPFTLIRNTQLSTWLSLAYVGYLSTLVAFALWGNLLNRYATAKVTPFALLVPVVGVTTANILFGETLSAFERLGATFIFAALVFTVFGNNLLGLIKEKNRALFYR